MRKLGRAEDFPVDHRACAGTIPQERPTAWILAGCAKAQTGNRVGISHGRMGQWRKAVISCDLLPWQRSSWAIPRQHPMLMVQTNRDTHNFSLFYSSWWGSRYTFSKVVLIGNYSLEMSSTLFIKDQETPLCVSAVELCGTDTVKRGAAGVDSYPQGYLRNTQCSTAVNRWSLARVFWHGDNWWALLTTQSNMQHRTISLRTLIGPITGAGYNQACSKVDLIHLEDTACHWEVLKG